MKGIFPLSVFLLSLAALLAVGVTGCGSSAGKQYYQISLAPATAVSNTDSDGPAPKPQIDKNLVIESVDVEDIYNDYRVVYRTSPYQLNFYSYHFWIKKPEKMFKDVIKDYFADSYMFKSVITNFADGDPDYILKTDVHVMEEFDSPGSWFAHLKMDFRVLDFQSNKTVITHSFNRQKRLRQKKVGEIPIALSTLLKEELDILVQKLKAEIAGEI